jgi:two-component system, OmpR family, sensor histidine kinase NblS
MAITVPEVRRAIALWWSEFTLQTKLMILATLIVSLITTGMTFWAVNSIQKDAQMNDTRFGRDLGILLASNVAPLIAENKLDELAQFSYRFYNSTSSVRYMLYADPEGEIFLGIPFTQPTVQSALTIRRRIQLPEDYGKNQDLPLVRQHRTPKGEVTDVFVPLRHEEQDLGVLAIGINPNPTAAASSHLTRDVTVAVFMAIWAMVILGAVINALTITRPIKELSEGVHNIASGNFKQRIDLPFGGELGGLIGSFNDMARRLASYEEQNIEELTAEKAKLDTLMSTIADGAVLLNPDLHVVISNPTARRLLNWENRAVQGSHILPHLPSAIRNELAQALVELAQSEGDRPHEGEEFRITVLEPTKRTVRIMLTSVPGPQNERIKGIAMTVQDITREAELNEAKSHFISNVSHELRTPLFNIKSFIETLHDYGDELSEEERREFLATANSETDRLTRLVNDVLDLSRLESNRSYRFDAVDVAQAIDQTIRTYRLNAKDKGLELAHEIEPQIPAVVGNYDLLLQVLANLVGNALKFTPAGGRIVLRAYTLSCDRAELARVPEMLIPCKIRIEISDTGIGIDPEDQQAIFDRFFRVENRVHTLEGTGLGLSIVRNIVDRHHSQVQLVSEVGVGTTFWIDLAVYDDRYPAVAVETGEIAVPLESEGIKSTVL